MLKDIAGEENYIPLWDEVIIDAIKYGVISHARVQKLLNEQYNRAARFIVKTIEYRYFDDWQHPLISVEEYQELIAKRDL